MYMLINSDVQYIKLKEKNIIPIQNYNLSNPLVKPVTVNMLI